MSEETKNPAEETKTEEVAETKTATDDQAKADDSAEVEVPAQFKSIVESIEKMSVLELNELVKLLEKKFGVSASATAAPVAAAGGAEADEQSEFTVSLVDAGAQKIAVIKVVKEAAGLGLKEAKDLVDGAPADIKVGLKKEEAEALKKSLEEAGAKVELK